MVSEKIEYNALHLDQDLNWLSFLLDRRIKVDFSDKSKVNENLLDLFPAPAFGKIVSCYSQFVLEHNLSAAERLTVLLSLAPYLKPQLLDVFLIKNSDHNKQFTEFGGIESKQHKGFVPTGQTLLFLLAGNNLALRFSYFKLLEADSFLIKNNHISLETSSNDDPFISGTLLPSRELVELFTKGESFKPVFNASFPAKLINTGLSWDELILPNQTISQLTELNWWLKHQKTMHHDWGMNRKLKQGYRALFYGPPGTGKTLTAALIGKQQGLDVYQVDLAKVVSKYIGETEKNLAKVFDRAENKNWILFFDEADALFGKRTSVESSNDKHANQEVSYLLQRIEDYNGLVILATNLKTNIDDAFLRRFQSVVYFPMPKPEERYHLWKNALPDNCSIDNEESLMEVAQKYDVAGGTIINASQYCTLKALENGTTVITKNDLTEGINKELIKIGRTS